MDAEIIARISADYGVGIDVHSRFIQVCVLAQLDKFIHRWEAEYATTWEQLCEAREWVYSTLSQAIAERAPAPESLSYTLESTGCYHFAVMRAWKAEPHLVNPLLANKAQRKTDKLDARQLATQAHYRYDSIAPHPAIPSFPPRKKLARRAPLHYAPADVALRTGLASTIETGLVSKIGPVSTALAAVRRGTSALLELSTASGAVRDEPVSGFKGGTGHAPHSANSDSNPSGEGPQSPEGESNERVDP